MARHTRKKGSGNRWLLLVQILIMAGVLVFIIFFRDTIGSGAGQAFDAVAGTEDIRVENQKASTSDDEASATEAEDRRPAASPDAGESDTSND